jgi:NAD(P)-dependent dehydrogenase (short-subunit alcohol dehydrogenase family)
VFLVDRDLAAADETRGAIVDEGGRPVAFAGDVEDMRIRRAQLCPTGTQGDVWDTAYAALFLASEEAKYITGTTLMADGGITCRIR